MLRRHFGFAALAAAQQAQPPQPETFAYKKVAGLEIKLDLWPAPAAGRLPVAVWIHGGALIMGSRTLSPNTRVLNALQTAGFRVISIDYRLAPETKLPGIIEDVEDAFRAIRNRASEWNIDPGRLVVSGGSAGGYLTLTAGFRIKPRPKALAAFWGYGDIVGEWYSRPDPFYLKSQAITREDALAAVGQKAISEPPPKNSCGAFYLYCRQQGIWPKEVAGHDPDREDKWFDAYSPIRNVTRDYPPTILVHGTADTDVPHEQSVMMAAKLRAANVEHRFVSVPEGGHGIGNIAPLEQDRIYAEAVAFLRKFVE